MDPDKIFKFLIEHMADWSRITFLTLVKPITRFEPVPVSAGGTNSIIGHVQSERQLWLHPKLLIYALLSIILGLSINALIPNRNPGPELFAAVVIVFIYWLIGGSVMHLICLLLKGKGKYLETLSVFLQLSATLYVLTSFLSLLVASILLFPPAANIIGKIPFLGNAFIKNPVFVFFLVGTILSMAYFPLSMKPVHKFGWIRTLVIAMLPLLAVWFSVVIYIQYGLLSGVVK